MLAKSMIVCLIEPSAIILQNPKENRGNTEIMKEEGEEHKLI
jgi:hypothetical protein